MLEGLQVWALHRHVWRLILWLWHASLRAGFCACFHKIGFVGLSFTVIWFLIPWLWFQLACQTDSHFTLHFCSSVCSPSLQITYHRQYFPNSPTTLPSQALAFNLATSEWLSEEERANPWCTRPWEALCVPTPQLLGGKGRKCAQWQLPKLLSKVHVKWEVQIINKWVWTAWGVWHMYSVKPCQVKLILKDQLGEISSSPAVILGSLFLCLWEILRHFFPH